jgi:hypothetical protein
VIPRLAYRTVGALLRGLLWPVVAWRARRRPRVPVTVPRRQT